jgi:hypothetical protein
MLQYKVYQAKQNISVAALIATGVCKGRGRVTSSLELIIQESQSTVLYTDFSNLEKR